MRCKYRVAEILGVSNAAQHCEKERKGSFLNYKSAAPSGSGTGAQFSYFDMSRYSIDAIADKYLSSTSHSRG
jgi:hypothetical protein